jgi:DNA-binding transcriptional regulator GbsR (MarR family)
MDDTEDWAVVTGPTEIFRVTLDRKVIIPGDLYEAARDFWKIVQQLAPEGWKVEKVEEKGYFKRHV